MIVSRLIDHFLTIWANSCFAWILTLMECFKLVYFWTSSIVLGLAILPVMALSISNKEMWCLHLSIITKKRFIKSSSMFLNDSFVSVFFFFFRLMRSAHFFRFRWRKVHIYLLIVYVFTNLRLVFQPVLALCSALVRWCWNFSSFCCFVTSIIHCSFPRYPNRKIFKRQ